MRVLLLASVLFPLFLALLGILPRAARIFHPLAPWAALPALWLAVADKKGDLSLTLPSVLFGTHLGIDRIGNLFLLLTAFLWLISGLTSKMTSGLPAVNYSNSRYWFFFLLTMTGNIGVTVSQDAGSFYTFFALMTLGGFGLIAHDPSLAARAAGRVYISLALLGEMLILSGLILASHEAHSLDFQLIKETVSTSPFQNGIAALIFLGFGVKVGLVPFHLWLPPSYNAAPIPAAAVLSGAMTKAGILGWIRFLPLELVTSETWEIIAIGFGTLMAFYGALLGLAQVQTKAALAYSSLSQMGYLTIAIGTAVEPGGHFSRSLAACLAFAIHHGVAKASLFLGVGVIATTPQSTLSRKLILILLLCVSLSLVGLPFTGGAFVKTLLKESGSQDGIWHRISGWVTLAGSTATALLMARILVLYSRTPQAALQATLQATLQAAPQAAPRAFLKGRDASHPSLRIPCALMVSWAVLVLFSLFSPLLIPILLSGLGPADPVLSPKLDFSGSVRLISTLAIALLLTYPIWNRTTEEPAIPPGDLLVPVRSVIQKVHSAGAILLSHATARTTALLHQVTSRTISMLIHFFTEFDKLRTRGYAGVGMLLIVWAMFWLFFLSDRN